MAGKEQAEELVNYFNDKLAYIQKQLQGVPRRSLYFEYRTLGKTAVPGDYFYKMVEYSGADNIFAAAKGSQVDQEAIIEKDPQYIVKVADCQCSSFLSAADYRGRESNQKGACFTQRLGRH